MEVKTERRKKKIYIKTCEVILKIKNEYDWQQEFASNSWRSQ